MDEAQRIEVLEAQVRALTAAVRYLTQDLRGSLIDAVRANCTDAQALGWLDKMIPEKKGPLG